MRKMKDSGIEWIGQIPCDWSVWRLGAMASNTPYSMVDGPFGSDMKNEEYVDDGVPIVQLTNIKPFCHYRDSLKFITEEKHQQLIRHTANAGDIVIAKMMPAGRSCILSDDYKEYVVAADAIRFKVNDENEKRFILYALNTYCMTECELVSKGSTRVRISLEIARKLNLAMPLLPEQKKIADFLDEKCADIDQIRADIEKQIEILTDYKKSVITEAVTKGLDPKAKMKDSGIEWIGKIPEHWSVKRNKYIMRKQKIVKAKYENEDILSLTMNGVVVRDLENLTGKRPASFDGYQIVYPNNLLMCLFDIDVTPRCVGLIKNYGLTSPAYSQFVMQDFAYAPYYYYYYLNIDMTKELLHLAKNLRHSLTEDDLGAISTVLPPISEQKAIANYLDEKCSEIDATIAEKQKQLETLEDYKKSLIFEYVTGKKEVPA